MQLYDNDGFLTTAACAFIRAAPRAASAVIVIASREHLQALRAALAADGMPPVEPDGVLLVEAQAALAAFMREGRPDAQRFDEMMAGLLREASRQTSPETAFDSAAPVSVFSELVGLLYAGGNSEAAMRLEQLWECQVCDRSLRLLCAYPMSAFADQAHSEAFQRICALHSRVDPLERLWGIGDLDDLHRLVAQLQQRASALEAEVNRRRDAEWTAAMHDKRVAAMASVSAQLEKLASEDTLTGLANRRVFNDRLTHAVERAARTGTALALIFIDLDDFKCINDTYGHAAGDHLLKQVAARLTLCARAADTVCRWGGDEFGIITEDADAERAGVLMRRIELALAAPFDIRGKSMTVSASLGLCLYPHEAADADALVHNADAAMYRAKRNGKGAAAAAI